MRPSTLRLLPYCSGIPLGFVLLAALMHTVCSIHKENDNPYVGNMADYSYSGQITEDQVISRISASGKTVSMNQFKGRFVWADYAAPWCGPCTSQAPALKSLEEAFRKKAVFLTVITSRSPNYNDVPDQTTAKAWASRFGLNPDLVVAATNLWGWTVPTHILYSPEGQTLYRSTGYLSADQVRSTLSRYMQDWKNWSVERRRATWMR